MSLTDNIKRAGAWRMCMALMTGFLAAGQVMAQYHSADVNRNYVIEKSELTRLFQLANGFHVNLDNADGYDIGPGSTTGTRHSSDFNVQDWKLDKETELLRAIQLYNAGGYVPSAGTVDGFAPSPMTYLVIDLESLTVERLADVPAGGWTDAHKTTKLVLRRIPAGQFTMGAPSAELFRESNETQHAVTISADFFIGVFEVTQRQWELVMGTKPGYFTNAAAYATRPVEKVSYTMIRGNAAGVNATSFMGTLRAKLAGVTDLEFDLPTEAQWEYACRAGTTTSLNSGKEVTNNPSGACPNLAEVARYMYTGGYVNGKAAGATADADEGTAKVGSLPPNAWGLYDMHGNVAEWCLDYLGTYPATSVDPKGATSGSNRVLRGGSWFQNAKKARSAARDGLSANTAQIYSGLRVCAPMP